MALYESKFIRVEESFLKADILKAIYLANKVISRRIGVKIYTGRLPIDFITSKGKFSGLMCLITGKKMIRYNWAINDTSCTITSIDFWLKGMTARPTYNLETESLNIIKLIDTISSVLQNDIQPEYSVITESYKGKVTEDFTPKTGGGKSKAISDALKQWAIDKDVSDDRLQNTRISYLYKDFQFWFQEMAGPEFENMSEMTFRNYIMNFLKDRGLKNIYIRNLILRTGNKEKIVVTDKASEIAYQDISHLAMNVDDMKEFMADSLRAVARGFRTSLIIAGKAGFGKSSLTEKILKEEGMRVKSVQQIRNIKVLYNLFAQHGGPKDVILLDDTPDTFDKKFSGYLSAALDDKPKRIISFPSEMGKDMQDLKKFQPELLYQGKIVILTNKTKKEIPTYLKSRSIAIEVQADVSAMSDDIRKNLLNVLPQVPMESKLEVLDFIEKLGKHISSIDYRTFMLAVVFKSAGSPDWKKRVYALLK